MTASHASITDLYRHIRMLIRIVCAPFTINIFLNHCLVLVTFHVLRFVQMRKYSFIVSFFWCTLGYSVAREQGGNLKAVQYLFIFGL